ncbi:MULTISPECIES: phage antirepressor KilAC domain-containing protein [Bhargavaea]|uniref:Phage antirepressor KilAC domain-containing protein n=1 Tax=Bhargavaea changchunensis TaxID=2134037 RepID=A0ABW2NB57_9BACL|nr:phage antirepressor KilAC domain-containing protein [Bhargavaea sp. CC-171006]
MNELIPTQETNEGQIIVSGRDLHDFLEVKTEYRKWIGRMIEYGFTENADFIRVTQKCPTPGGVQEIADHHIRLDMAKEISMLQRNERGKMARQYFIEIERRWNSPEMVMKRAMDYLNAQVQKLTTQNLVLEQQVKEFQPKASYYDLILQNKSVISVSQIAKDYGMGAPTLNRKLKDLGVQYKQGGVWLLYAKYQDKGYTSTKTHAIDSEKSKLHTYWTQKGRLFIYDLLKSQGILPVIEREQIS